jgi:transcriptional regulator with XRE-family HTH domain
MTTALKFRNITASPDDPVDTWPFEGILAAVERGTLPDWRRLATAILADPWGPVAQQVLEAVRLSCPYGTAELLEGVVHRARKLAADSEREDVASEVRSLVGRSGLSKQDFAERIGTSRSRLSTYMSGKVVPSAALMVRMRRATLEASESAKAKPGGLTDRHRLAKHGHLDLAKRCSSDAADLRSRKYPTRLGA